jgi:hypothetical protein
MFGFGSKRKKYLSDLVDLLVDLGNISADEARDFIGKWEHWVISETYKRNLDPLSGVTNLAEKSMERIALAHQLKQYDEAKVVPDFMLLVALKAGIMLRNAAIEANMVPLNSYLPIVVGLPVDVRNSNFTYKDVLDALAASDPALTSQK